MGGKDTEACGRCSVSTVLDAAESADDGEGDASAANPFDDGRIELEEADLRRIVRHEVFVRRVKDRLDALATRLIYG